MKNIVMMIKHSARLLYQYKLRSILSILGISCGVAAVLCILAIGEGAKQEILNQIGQLGANNIYIMAKQLSDNQTGVKDDKIISQGLSMYDVERLLKVSNLISDIAAINEVSASAATTLDSITSHVIGCNPALAKIQNLWVSQGRFIVDEDIRQKKLVCILGDSVSKELGANGRIGGYIRLNNNILKIVGVIKRPEKKSVKSSAITMRNLNDTILVPLGVEGILRKKTSGNASPEVNELIIQIREEGHVLNTLDVISRTLELTHDGVKDYQIVAPLELLQQSKRAQRTLNMVLGGFAGISLIAGGIGIMNIMLVTVSERIKEIGIKRAVGATRGHIIFQFLSEAVLLTFTGGIAGIVFGIAGERLTAHLTGWSTTITVSSVALPLIMSTVMGIFFGSYPAWLAAKMDPLIALRYE